MRQGRPKLRDELSFRLRIEVASYAARIRENELRRGGELAIDASELRRISGRQCPFCPYVCHYYFGGGVTISSLIFRASV